MTTTSRPLPRKTRTRMQALLDEGDRAWFARNPGEQSRTWMHFLGEQMNGGEPARSIVVTIEVGRLVRHLATARGDA